ncbi:MAG: EamA family transporter, partial [Anaerotignum sp.]|nr:EamA family transporter [Anaerotignum sp.]
TSHIIALLYLGAFPSATAYFLWGKAMSFAERTSEVTNFMFVTPLLSTIMGFIILREVPNAGTFIGGAIIIISIIVFNLRGK